MFEEIITKKKKIDWVLNIPILDIDPIVSIEERNRRKLISDLLRGKF